MFKITKYPYRADAVMDCMASTESELPNKDACIDSRIPFGSNCLVIDTSKVYILDEGYVWKTI